MGRPPLGSTKFPARVDLPVEWNYLDAFGHVNNTHYIRWFESARVAYLQGCELITWMKPDPVGPILASIECHYRRPLYFPDTVRIGARAEEIGRSRMVLYHMVYSLQQREIVADGRSYVVLFDYHRERPTRIPDEDRQRIEQFEATAVSLEESTA